MLVLSQTTKIHASTGSFVYTIIAFEGDKNNVEIDRNVSHQQLLGFDDEEFMLNFSNFFAGTFPFSCVIYRFMIHLVSYFI